MREVVVPHEPDVGPLTAVRRMLIQSSLTALQDFGHFERYRAVIDPEAFAQLTDSIGPGWVPVELALAHYRACDALKLDTTEVERLGSRVGDRVQRALLVLSKSMVDQPALAPWPAMPAFARMRRRMLQGSSSEYAKLSHTELQIETLGNVLLGVPYYRSAFGSWLCAALRGLGVDVTNARITSFRKDGLECEIRLAW